ncbi:nucleotide exchange factor GrpE [Defluviitoga tunisiensis]|uniref:Protein GrpE n=1 Tax=Defluviitoga tunisiensis TaxID=1006576 RepID=A0A0C7P007_DEFTU|nr:nucleotide exchange factor GrpE [Defluviitoga tunisiensis]CEP77349.1 GrpE protein [Defluviitoga tunisiensis]
MEDKKEVIEKNCGKNNMNGESNSNVTKNVDSLDENVEALQREIQELKDRIEKIKDEREKYKDSLYRLSAKFEHYKEMVEKEKRNIQFNTKKNIVELFLIPFEKLKISMKYKDDPEFIKAIEMIYKDIINVFKNLNLEFIVPEKGDQFDPFEHEVVEKFETDEVNEYCIYDVQSIGYKLEGEVIKPARVVVAIKPKDIIEKGCKSQNSEEEEDKEGDQ